MGKKQNAVAKRPITRDATDEIERLSSIDMPRAEYIAALEEIVVFAEASIDAAKDDERREQERERGDG